MQYICILLADDETTTTPFMTTTSRFETTDNLVVCKVTITLHMQ